MGQRKRRQQWPMSQKASQQWLTSLDAVRSAHDWRPQTRVVSMGDREAEVYDLLAAERPAGVDLLVRASWDRGVDAPERYGWGTVAAQPSVEHRVWHVPRRGLQPAREATLALRFCPLSRCPPQHRQSEGLPTGPLWAVQGREVEPPPDGTPMEWLLLSTVAVHTTEDAIERVAWYACRWGMEVWQRMLKRGGRIEARQLGTGERWHRCLTRYRVMAWRVL